MKMKYDTSTVQGKIAVMAEFEKTYKWPYAISKLQRDEWSQNCEPAWDWDGCDYNYPAEPEPPKLVPWTFETCPKGVVLVREIGGTLVDLVSTWSRDHVKMVAGQWSGYGWMAAQCEHSLDNGRTWLPCGTEENQ